MTKLDELQELQEDPQNTLTRVFTENRSALRRLVASRLDTNIKGRVDPSDIVQETLIDACRRLDDYLANPSVPFISWLFALADQNAVDAYRRHVVTKKRSVQREQFLDSRASAAQNDIHMHAVSDLTDPGQRAEKQERMAQLQKAISMLSLESQIIVRMRFLEGKTLAEIAEKFDISVDAVAKRAMRSLLKLTEFANELGLGDTD